MSFRKDDTGKARFDLIDPLFELELARVLTYGAAKYEDDLNWQKADPQEARKRYYAAFRRHTNSWIQGETLDPETGFSHLAHATASLMFLHYFDRSGESSHEPEQRCPGSTDCPGCDR